MKNATLNSPMAALKNISVLSRLSWAALLLCLTWTSSCDDPPASEKDNSEADASAHQNPSDGGGADCGDLPGLPIKEYKTISGPGKGEDFAFDTQGKMISIADGHLLSFDHDGKMTILVPNVLEKNFHGDQTSHGLAALPNGDIVFADSGKGSLMRVDIDQKTVTEILGKLPFPNGVIVDRKGFVYVTVVADKPGSTVTIEDIDLDNITEKGVVVRINPDNGDYVIVADKLTLPNGLAFSKDYDTLYIGSHDAGGRIFALDIASGDTKLFAAGIGKEEGNLDGLTVDMCGNVYATEIESGTAWRISSDGENIELLVDVYKSSPWTPNLHFGSGLGGWDASNLYIINYEKAEIYEVKVGAVGVAPANL